MHLQESMDATKYVKVTSYLFQSSNRNVRPAEQLSDHEPDTINDYDPDLDFCDASVYYAEDYSISSDKDETAEQNENAAKGDDAPVFDYSAGETLDHGDADTTSKRLYKLSVQHKVSRTFYDEMTKIFNEYVDGSNEPLLSYFRSKNLLWQDYPVKPVAYDVCRRGCMMYQRNDGLKQCTYCNRPRFSNKRNCDGTQKPLASVLQLPLSNQLASLIQNEITRNDLMYRSSLPARKAGLYTDIFDGDVYTALKGEGLFSGDLDIALALYTDGFTVKRKQLTIVHLIILNLPPSIRYETKNMIQVCVLPGSRAPKDLFSFLRPLMDDLKQLQSTGIQVKADDNKTYNIRAHLLLSTGDIPAASKVMCHSGHMTKYGCRLCETKGASLQKAVGKRSGMYFTPKRYPKPKARTLKFLKSGNAVKGSQEERHSCA